MPSPTVAELEASAQKAQAVLRRRNARVRQAKRAQQAQRHQAVLALLDEVGLLAYDLTTLRAPLAHLAAQMRAGEAEAILLQTPSGDTP
jgi:hypothetical protein